MKICEYCGIEFTPVKQAGNRQRFCGEPCQRAWWSENQETASKQFTFVCGNCGKEYKTRHSDRNQYCSRKCAFADSKAWNKPYKPPKQEITCKFCGNVFDGYKTESKGYCSDKCRKESTKLTCDYCGIEFFYKLPFTKYCSQECQYETMLQNARVEHSLVRVYLH